MPRKREYTKPTMTKHSLGALLGLDPDDQSMEVNMNGANRFWSAMNKSVVVSSLLALLVVGAVVYLAVTQVPVPEVLTLAMGTILGFFFGARSGQQTERVQAANAALRVKERYAYLNGSVRHRRERPDLDDGRDPPIAGVDG